MAYLKYLSSLLKQRTIQLILTVVIYVLIADKLPLEAHKALYALSLSIKDILILIMPLTVGFFIAHTVNNFEKKAPAFVLALIIFEAVSNMTAVWYGFISGELIVNHLPQLVLKKIDIDFTPLWHLNIKPPSWWSPDKGTISGLLLGIISVFSNSDSLKDWISQGRNIMEFVLTKVFAPLVPIFILGFSAYMYQTHVLYDIFIHYSSVVAWLVIVLVSYIMILISIGAGLSFRKVVFHTKNLILPGITGLISSCSFSTMPITISSTAKNLDNPDLARGVIPATTNIQLIGDIIMNTFLCFVIYRNFHGVNPSFAIWIQFSLIFVLFRFATSCVLGGAIFIMIPIYQKYLDFTPEMIALIWAFNVILDPIVTFGNIMGNAALCRVFEQVLNIFLPKTKLTRQADKQYK